MQALEMLVAPAVEQPPLAAPPTSPVHGCCYIVAASPSGAWSGKADCLAVFTCGGWRFVMPADGVTAYVRSTRSLAIYRDGEWALTAGSIASPAGGTTVDSQARSAIDQMLGALRQHGLIAS